MSTAVASCLKLSKVGELIMTLLENLQYSERAAERIQHSMIECLHITHATQFRVCPDRVV